MMSSQNIQDNSQTIQSKFFKELERLLEPNDFDMPQILHISKEHYDQYSEMGMVEFVNIINQYLKTNDKASVRFSPELFPIVYDAFNGIKNTTWLNFFTLTDDQVMEYHKRARLAQGLKPVPKVYFDADNDTDCKICFMAITKPIILDCGHVLCNNCSKKLVNKCPFCKVAVNPMKLNQSGQFVDVRQQTQVPRYIPNHSPFTFSALPATVDFQPKFPRFQPLPLTQPDVLDLTFKPCEHLGVDSDDIGTPEPICAGPKLTTITIESLVSNTDGIVHFNVPQNPKIDNDHTDWIVVLDVSGSMSVHFDNMLAKIKLFIDHMKPYDRICVIVFSKEAYQLFPLSRPSPAIKDKITINTIFGSCTNYKIAGELALQTIQQAQSRNTERQTMCIFITDGEATDHQEGYGVIREIIQQPRTSSLVCSFGAGIKYATIEEILLPIQSTHVYIHYENWDEFSMMINGKAKSSTFAMSNVEMTFTNESETFTTKSKDLFWSQSYLKYVKVPFVPTKLIVKWIEGGVEHTNDVPMNAEWLANNLEIFTKKTEVEVLQTNLGKELSACFDPKGKIDEFKAISQMIVDKIIRIPDMTIRDFLMNLQKKFIETIKQIENPHCPAYIARTISVSSSNRIISDLSQQ